MQDGGGRGGGGGARVTEIEEHWRRRSDNRAKRKVKEEGGVEGSPSTETSRQRARSALLPTRMMGTWSA